MTAEIITLESRSYRDLPLDVLIEMYEETLLIRGESAMSDVIPHGEDRRIAALEKELRRRGLPPPAV